MEKRKSVNCLQCKYYYVTWDRSFPYGCKALGFKSKYCPSREVSLASGLECQYYKDKTKK